MRKLLLPVLLGLVCTSFTLIPSAPGSQLKTLPVLRSHTTEDSALSGNSEASLIYDKTGLSALGLTRQAFDYAWKGYQHLLNKNLLAHTRYLTICDMSQSSSRKRLYIIDAVNGRLITNTYVAHGKNSGGEFATKFSNTPESLQSSLGFYITRQTYTGEHGLSLRISGVEPGFNDNAMARSIVIHGAAYVDDARAKAGIFMGRSFGCPAVPQRESEKIIQTIKNGTCLFIYHPGGNYLAHSKILNG
ncbi:MAG: murein L,D-transpeptidase catalytic domain family protein [Chitinophagaceae bacterium]|nr:murein L,D-transpeptidase catalytic domain family protein [Chitinophagaceae bacterium]